MAATDTLQNGTFRFELTIAGNELEGYGLMARDDTKFPPMLLELWVNPGSHLLIQGENPYIYSWKVESDVKEQQFQQQLIQASHKEWEEFQRLTMQELPQKRDLFCPRSSHGPPSGISVFGQAGDKPVHGNQPDAD